MTHTKGLAISLAVVTALGLGGCGNSAQKNNTPTVERGGDTEGNNDLSRYTNADWLFQNYFGEYGLPDELKVMMMPELKMLANGFALQQAKGEDVDKSISELNHDMMMLRISGKFDTMVKGMIEEYETGLYDRNRTVVHDDNTTYHPNISEDAKKNIEESVRREEEYKQKQLDLVKQYNLPYTIAGMNTQVVEYSSAMSSSGSKSSGGGSSYEPGFSGIDDWDWWDADPFWTDGAKGIGHMGLIRANDHGDDWVVDLMPDVGVTSHHGITWYLNMNDWSRVEGWYYNRWTKYDYRRDRIMDWAEGKIGKTVYALNLLKGNRHATYCSSFVWEAFHLTTGVDLDKNGGNVVWPRDITGHEDMRMFNSQNR